MNYHNYIPPRVEPKTIGIIGGRGAMGRLLAQEYEKEGYRVLVTGEDPATYITGRPLITLNRKLVQESDVIVLAVPVHVIGKGIHKTLGGQFRRGLRDKLIMDVTSTKSESMREMAKIPGATIIGTHPMFGPGVKNFKGQNVFVTPLRRNHYVLDARLEKWLDWVESFWKKRGAIVRHISAEEHDRITPLVQGGVFTIVALYAAALRASNADLRLLKDIATPNSTLLTAMMGRMIRPNTLEVYLNILMGNEHNVAFAQAVADEAQKIANMLKGQDRDGVAAFIRKLSDNQPDDFNKSGHDLTVFIQEAIANRSEIENLSLAKSRALPHEFLDRIRYTISKGVPPDSSGN